MNLLAVRDLTLRFGAITAFEGVSFDVSSRRAVRRHRPERRRQELALQRAVARVRAGRRQRAARRPRLPARAARPARRAGRRPQLPEPRGRPPPHGARERARRPPSPDAHAASSAAASGSRAREERRHRAAAMEALEFVGLADHAGDRGAAPALRPPQARRARALPGDGADADAARRAGRGHERGRARRDHASSSAACATSAT